MASEIATRSPSSASCDLVRDEPEASFEAGALARDVDAEATELGVVDREVARAGLRE
ncbi:MAG: hypothetical protein U0235_03945 [Polyangiaceae bacterium]